MHSTRTRRFRNEPVIDTLDDTDTIDALNAQIAAVQATFDNSDDIMVRDRLDQVRAELTKKRDEIRDGTADAGERSVHVPSSPAEFGFTKHNGDWAIKAWDAPNALPGDEVTVTSRNGTKLLILGDELKRDRRLRVFAIAGEPKDLTKNSAVARDPKPSGIAQFRDDVPAARYAITGDDGTTDFYKVDRPTEGRWAGYVFVKLIVGGGFEGADTEQRLGMKQQATILDRIAEAGVAESMMRYGREIGKCGHCGRTLTDETSRAKGIGPVCEDNLGW